MELSLVLLVCIANSIITSLDILINGRGSLPNPQNFRWTAGIVHEVAGLLLLGYVLARRRIRITALGLRWSLRDLGMGLVVAAGALLAYWTGPYLIHLVDHAMYSSVHNGQAMRELFGRPSIMTVPYFLLNPFFEELVVRAYLMTEVRALTGSWALAAALSVIVQFSYHLYYGWEGAVAVSFLFLVFAIYYARTQKATPIIVAHGIFDFLGLVRMF
ncbi:MAG: CPBP family intramembrane glutamic endopeptidase [Terracidiphilus sp.]